MRLPGTLARLLLATLITLATADAQIHVQAPTGTVGPGKTESGSQGTLTRLPNASAADKQQCETFLRQWGSLSPALQRNPALIARKNACDAVVNPR